jgi:hypothetical protein
VDLGHAYERRQFVQGAANDAARGGAYEVYAGWLASSSPPGDAQVVARMVETLKNSGLTVANINPADINNPNPVAPVLTTPNGSACANLGPSNQAYLQAAYLDANQQPVGEVGSLAIPTSAVAVKVTSLEMCVQHFFVGVIGYGNFDVASDGFSLVNPSATEGSTSGGSGGGGGAKQGPADFYAWVPTNCQDPQKKPPSPLCTDTTYRLFADGSPDGAGSSKYPGDKYQQPPGCTSTNNWCAGHTGDLVTIHDFSNGQSNWDAYQFANVYEALGNTPGAPLQIGSESDRGCLNPFTSNLVFGAWSFNRNGNGAHCAKAPTDGSTVVIPLVDQVCKNTGSSTSECLASLEDTSPPGATPVCANGGYCVRVIGIVAVHIVRDLTDGKLVRGYITSVLDDPYCLVEAPAGTTHPGPIAASLGINGTQLISATNPITVGAPLLTPGTSVEYKNVTLGGATGGTFTLSVTNAGSTHTTAPISVTAPLTPTAQTVQTALQALPNLANDAVTVTGSNGSFDITITGTNDQSWDHPLKWPTSNGQIVPFPPCLPTL